MVYLSTSMSDAVALLVVSLKINVAEVSRVMLRKCQEKGVKRVNNVSQKGHLVRPNGQYGAFGTLVTKEASNAALNLPRDPRLSGREEP